MGFTPPRYLLLQVGDDFTVKVVGQFQYAPDDEDVALAIDGLENGSHCTLIDVRGFGSHVVSTFRVETITRLVNLGYEN